MIFMCLVFPLQAWEGEGAFETRGVPFISFLLVFVRVPLCVFFFSSCLGLFSPVFRSCLHLTVDVFARVFVFSSCSELRRRRSVRRAGRKAWVLQVPQGAVERNTCLGE